MSIITAKGQTVELAVQDALRQLNVSKDRVDINIIDEGKRVLRFIWEPTCSSRSCIEERSIQECEEYLKMLFTIWVWKLRLVKL